jgi:hypothetical protein
VRHKASTNWAISLIAAIITTSAFAADRYDLLFTEASYANPEQSELDYSSFVGDRQTGAIYSCVGKVILQRTTGDVARHTESCADAYVPPSGLPPGEYTFSRMSALDPTAKSNAPKMNPAWGFWRIDQAKHLHAFCTRSGLPAKWTCFETPLPER